MDILLQKIAWARAQEYIKIYKPKIICIAGNYGTAVSAEAIKHILQGPHNVRIPQKPIRNLIDIPLSILGLQSAKKRLHWIKLLIGSKAKEIAEAEPDIIILELNLHKPNEIKKILEYLTPHITILGSIGTAHLDVFHTTKELLREVSYLYAGQKKPDSLIFSTDQPYTDDVRKIQKISSVSYGKIHGADIQLVRAQSLDGTKVGAEIRIGKHNHEVLFQHLGSPHLMPYILPAIAVCQHLKLDMKKILSKIATLQVPEGNFSSHSLHGYTLINDTNTATLESVTAALRAIDAMQAKRKIVVIGDMENLGSKASEFYPAIGTQAAEVADIVIAVGKEAAQLGAAALKTKQTDVHHFHESQDAGKWIGSYITSGDLVYLTGAASQDMHFIVDRLKTHGTE